MKWRPAMLAAINVAKNMTGLSIRPSLSGKKNPATLGRALRHPARESSPDNSRCAWGVKVASSKFHHWNRPARNQLLRRFVSALEACSAFKHHDVADRGFGSEGVAGLGPPKAAKDEMDIRIE
jgi:hypothetical protein